MQFIYLVILYPNNNSWLVNKDQQVHHNACDTHFINWLESQVLFLLNNNLKDLPSVSFIEFWRYNQGTSNFALLHVHDPKQHLQKECKMCAFNNYIVTPLITQNVERFLNLNTVLQTSPYAWNTWTYIMWSMQ